MQFFLLDGAVFWRKPAVRWFLLLVWTGMAGSAFLGLPLAWAGQAPQERVYEALVTRVFDGDTVWVKPLAGGRYRKLRLDGLDAPEICQAGGSASRDALAGRILERRVIVRERRSDDYGRALVRLLVDGEDVGAWLVRNGHAWSYRWRRDAGPFAEEEAKARLLRQGLFAAPDAENPRDFRRRHGPCSLP